MKKFCTNYNIIKHKKYVSINSVIQNVLLSKNIHYYSNKIHNDNYKIYNNEKYISKKTLIGFLETCKNKEAKKAVDTIISKKKEPEFEIDIESGIMLYDNKSITINTINNELWIKAKDITSILGFRNSKKTISQYVDNDDICKQYILDNTLKRNNSPLYINESGFYALVLNSEHKQAKKIKRWVTKVVLPTIRKTGIYNHMEEIKSLQAEIKKLKDSKNKIIRKKKEPIPKAVRLKVWSKYIGYNNIDGKCFCCRDKIIHQQDFHCGHIQSEYNGGKVTIQNLRPICSICNTSMGTKHMVEFMEQYGYDTSHFN
jgi:prophage antirepressor-like protein